MAAFLHDFRFSSTPLAIAGALVLACFRLASAEPADSGVAPPLTPQVAQASNEAAEAMAGIRIPDGWKIGLFAAEPDVANIVAFDISRDGKVYVCESFRQNRGVTDNRGHDEEWLLADLAAQTVQDRIDYHKRLLGDAAATYTQHDDRIRRLVDTDGDGKADRSEVIASGFNHLEEGTGASVLVRGNSVYYTCIPKLWRLVDQDGDGSIDKRVVLSDGYGVRVAFRGHDLHGLTIGPDGRLYFSIGDRGYNVTTADGSVLANPAVGAVFRCELDGTGLEVYCNGLRNPQELAFNDWGDFFTVDNNSDSGDKARLVHLLEGGDTGWRMHYQYLPDRGPFNRERIWEPFHNEQPAYINPPITNFTDGPSGLVYYPGTGFGDSLENRFLVCDFRGGPSNSGIRSFTLDPDGAFYELASDDQPIWNVLATDVAFSPDGALYVSDWVDGWDGLGKGRMYRLTDPEHAESEIVHEVQRLLGSDWSARAVTDLIAGLGHTDRRVRLESQWELATRGEVAELMAVATDASRGSIPRLHAIWGVDQIARQNESTRSAVVGGLRGLLTDSDPLMRAAVAKVAGERGDEAAVATLRQLLKDPSARVRYFATMALGHLDDSQAFTGVVSLLAENDNADPALRHAGVMYLSRAVQPKQIATLTSHENISVRRAAVVALRRVKAGEITTFLDDASSLVVTEAARAIHDVPIPVAMDELAGLETGDVASDAILRRVLNANFRIGTPAQAIVLAKYAARASAPEAMRIEALDMLANWANPDPRDRVTNEFHALSTRSAQDAATALAPEIDSLMAARDAVREKATEVASALGIKRIIPQLVSRVNDESQGSPVRATALLGLARLDAAKAVQLARGVELSPANQLVEAALQVLAEHDPAASLPTFIAATESNNVRVRQQAWDILSRSSAPAAAAKIAEAVQAYLNGNLAAAVHLNVLQAAEGKLKPELAKQLADHQANVNAADPLGPWLASLQGGNPHSGKRIFFEKTELSCVRCHKVDRTGGEVGPELTTIGKTRDQRYLLESISLPNAQIAKGFETTVIANDSGQVFTGIIKEETDDFVVLIQADGSQKQVYLDEIIARKAGKSSMPDDLIKFMSPRELRDLVAYLASLRVDPRGADDVE